MKIANDDQSKSIIATYILRVRRIETHSLLQDQEKVRTFRTGQFTVLQNLNGKITIKRELPPEEPFESLVARLRPILLNQETLHYGRVINAARKLINESSPSENARLNKKYFTPLLNAWKKWTFDSTDVPAGYSVIESHVDRPSESIQMTDKQLAGAFVYADLVHATPDEKYLPAMNMSIDERFAAAVPVFYNLAVLAISTKNILLELHEKGHLPLPDGCLSTPVNVSGEELISEDAELWISDVGVTPHTLENLSSEESPWQKFSVSEFLVDNDPSRRFGIEIFNADQCISKWECVAMDRRKVDSHFELNLLIEDSFYMTWKWKLEDEELKNGQFNISPEASSNKGFLRRLCFIQDCAQSSHLNLSGNGDLWVQAEINQEIGGEQNDDLIEVFADLVLLEKALNTEFDLLGGNIEAAERIDLRRLRLLAEGYLIPTHSGSRIFTPNDWKGDQTAEWASFTTEEESFSIANLTLPVPPTKIVATNWQLARRVTDEEKVEQFIATPIDDEVPSQWDPERVEIYPRFSYASVALPGLAVPDLRRALEG